MARPVVREPGEGPPRTTSSLYCRYHGFLIGQALALAFADGAGDDPGYAERRVRLLACLRELDIDIAIPERPDQRGDVSHAALLAAILPRLAQQARELAEFAILGGLLVLYATAARCDADAAAALRLEIERLRGAYDLPPVDAVRHAAVTGGAEPDRVLATGLAYLGEIVARVPAEPETALVLMPISAPYDEYYAAFHRPSLEHCGYRALRAWGGAGGDAAAGLVFGLLAKSGLVWADVSEIDHGLVVAIGAAQALGRPGMVVVREDRAATVPPHIGRDAVIRYDPRAADWPDGPVLLMAACLAGITLAAERGDRLRVTPSAIEDAFDEVSRALGRILLPPEAREAQRRGRRAMDGGDLTLAEASFDEAYRLGLHDDETRLWRGWARLGLGRLVEAAADLDAVVGADPQAPPVGEWRPIAAYLRAVLREAQGDLAGALRDFELAVALGLTDAEVRGKRDELAARVPS
jgi:hypothetical protein